MDLKRLTERSVGVFGKSGTGKSFLTRVLLSGIIARRAAVNLVFDMHNDYGFEVQTETGGRVKGLKQLFGDLLMRQSTGRMSIGFWFTDSIS